ncbi:spermidine synthase [Nocardioidaceae bacterium]|nr:spermidine synthase [Nocardioidaceae bacterium]
MGRRLEELGSAATRMGLLTLRRRYDPALRQDLYEVKLDDEFLMSSAWTVAERRLATAALDQVDTDGGLRVLVGGLGLGYTALAALADERVSDLVVVDALAAMIAWHREGLLPEAAPLVEGPRCRLVEADFFAWARGATELDGPDAYDVVMLDVDHSPRHLLDASHADLYSAAGLRSLRRRLTADGVFALWSDDPPDDDLLAAARTVFDTVQAEVVSFPNPLTRGRSTATVYVAR